MKDTVFRQIGEELMNLLVGSNDYDYTGTVDGGVFTYLLRTPTTWISLALLHALCSLHQSVTSQWNQTPLENKRLHLMKWCGSMLFPLPHFLWSFISVCKYRWDMFTPLFLLPINPSVLGVRRLEKAELAAGHFEELFTFVALLSPFCCFLFRVFCHSFNFLKNTFLKNYHMGKLSESLFSTAVRSVRDLFCVRMLNGKAIVLAVHLAFQSGIIFPPFLYCL